MSRITAFVALAFARHYLGWPWGVWIIYGIVWALEEIAAFSTSREKTK